MLCNPPYISPTTLPSHLPLQHVLFHILCYNNLSQCVLSPLPCKLLPWPLTNVLTSMDIPNEESIARYSKLTPANERKPEKFIFLNLYHTQRERYGGSIWGRDEKMVRDHGGGWLQEIRIFWKEQGMKTRDGYKVPLLAEELAIDAGSQSSLSMSSLVGAHFTSVDGHTSKIIWAVHIEFERYKQHSKKKYQEDTKLGG